MNKNTNTLKAKEKENNYRHSCVLIVFKKRNGWKPSIQAMPRHSILLLHLQGHGRNFGCDVRWQIWLRRVIRRSFENRSPNHSEMAAGTFADLGGGRAGSGDFGSATIGIGIGGVIIKMGSARRRRWWWWWWRLKFGVFARLGGRVRSLRRIDYGPQCVVVEVFVVEWVRNRWSGGHLDWFRVFQEANRGTDSYHGF